MPTPPAACKAELRQRMRTLRTARPAADAHAASGAAVARLLDSPDLRTAVVFFTYVAVRGELDTAPLLAALFAAGRTVLVPRCTAEPGVMHPVAITSLHDLTPGPHRIPQPARGTPWTATIDVCIVPGLAFDLRGHRLGSGAGFYDRFLATHRPRLVVGLAFDDQVLDALPTEPHDRPVDLIVTPTRTLTPLRPAADPPPVPPPA